MIGFETDMSSQNSSGADQPVFLVYEPLLSSHTAVNVKSWAPFTTQGTTYVVYDHYGAVYLVWLFHLFKLVVPESCLLVLHF